MNPHEDPEERIRELERPLADAARTSEVGDPQPGGQAYAPGPPVPPPPGQWTYGGGPFSGPPPKPPSGNRVWWILGTVIVIGMLALAGGIAAFAAHQLSGVRSIITSPPTISVPFTSPSNNPTKSPPSTSRTRTSAPSTSAAPPAGGQLNISGINENRTIACNDSIVSVSGVSNTVVITGHCASLTVSGVQNSITVDAVDTIDASGFNNKVTYHAGTPKISNAGDANVVEQG
ncbi:DUF3060 domain-containing protein [Mycobacterium sp. 663a-19]|uniref:DUF3060 domain-containing protein n=1 Tax=Mycobacterium sp. 663a-19 TaxID=2986148 RepID=UPI002D1E802B|nr:DUF3060 domain-containing protein [Mycobacterium sp. 663a-19]MEB3984353.1 DUF3060 domain-containing protein [Mycobacterium sp. 663a-19]